MKKLLLLFIPFIFCAPAKPQQAGPGAPVMKFDTTIYDFGGVEQGTLIVHNFRFTNTGNANLIIESAMASDGGSIAEFPEGAFAPGESGFIKITQLTKGRMGQMNKITAVHSNSADGIVVLHLKGNVYLPPVMKFDSTAYTFGKVKQGERVNLELHFTNTGKEPLIINNCVTACGCDVAEASREPIPPGGSGIVKYTLDTNSRSGMQHKTITITYNTDRVLVINIRGEIIRD